MRRKFTRIKINTFSRPKLLSIITFVLTLFLVFLHIFQSSLIVKSSFLINEYERKIKDLSAENKNLEIVFSQKNSLSNSKNYLEELGFEKVSGIDYIRVMEGSVAAK